jgi:hypothetical protein
MDALDHRPDLWGRVEGPADAPDHIVRRALSIECPDCLVNVFIESDESDPTGYRLNIAHDERCPWLARHEEAS